MVESTRVNLHAGSQRTKHLQCDRAAFGLQGETRIPFPHHRKLARSEGRHLDIE